MEDGPGQESGQVGFAWDDFVDQLVAARGSLAQAAQHLAERRGFSEDVGSVERGLRRLRSRGTRDGGVWGQRALHCFGLPGGVTERIRWMGQYHTRFTDLPVSLCEELVRPWDRPPISESPARVWILLAHASIALRQRADPEAALEQAALLAARAGLAAELELALVEAFYWYRRAPERGQGALERAQGLVEEGPRAGLEADDHACLFARWIDQRAYPLNRPGKGQAADHAGAVELYARIPADGPLFARCRRENGLGWSRLQLGEREAAEQHARASMAAAGDSGSLRMRAMALNLLAATYEAGARTQAAHEARERARAIAQRLEDEALALRFRPRRTRATP